MAADNRVRDLAQADEDRQHRERVARLVASNGVPKRYQGASLMDVDAVPLPTQPQYLEACHALSALFERPMMVAMLGGRGAGKTHMACGLVNDFCRAGRFALYVVAMDYFIALQETYGDGAKEKASAIEAKYLKPELLVLDAMEERANTEWNGRMLTHLINKRYAAELATVLISNEQQPQFVQRVGESIADRIRDEGGMIECTWKSLRGRLLKEEAA